MNSVCVKFIFEITFYLPQPKTVHKRAEPKNCHSIVKYIKIGFYGVENLLFEVGLS